MYKLFLYLVLCWFLIGFNSLSAKPKKQIPDSLQVLLFEVNGVTFSMKRVEGGVFIMGGTPEQHNEPISTEMDYY